MVNLDPAAAKWALFEFNEREDSLTALDLSDRPTNLLLSNVSPNRSRRSMPSFPTAKSPLSPPPNSPSAGAASNSHAHA
jgi:hypothetical protein